MGHTHDRKHARETGIIEEIKLENQKRNPAYSFSLFDTILWEKTHLQPGLDLMLNTHMIDGVKEAGRVRSVSAIQLTTETQYTIRGTIFIDATGDGTLASQVGAPVMKGREPQSAHGEPHAPHEGDSVTMGNTILFETVDMGEPVPFTKPDWAYSIPETILESRDHDDLSAGYWWLEVGGKALSTIEDGEKIRDELLKYLYGIWDHIKNSGHHEAANLALGWIGFLPGKRESRRIEGLYILREQDVTSGRIFPDGVAYGGWPIDNHIPGGIMNPAPPNTFLPLDQIYSIPLRSLIAKNIDNLFLAGRAVSATHQAFASLRVMGTTAVIGQAAGTAAAYAVSNALLPYQFGEHNGENAHTHAIRQHLLQDDAFIPGAINEDTHDVARNACVSADSFLPGGEPFHVINGISRQTATCTNCWISEVMEAHDPASLPTLTLQWENTIHISEVRITFDSNLSKETLLSISRSVTNRWPLEVPSELVKDYTLDFFLRGQLIDHIAVDGNYQRHRIHELSQIRSCDKITITVHSTYGSPSARIFEMRVY
jgi:hypothetical protein